MCLSLPARRILSRKVTLHGVDFSYTVNDQVPSIPQTYDSRITSILDKPSAPTLHAHLVPASIDITTNSSACLVQRPSPPTQFFSASLEQGVLHRASVNQGKISMSW